MSGILRSAQGKPRTLATAIAALFLGGCAYAVVNGGAVNRTKSDEVKQGIQQIRQLSFRAPVPIIIEDKDEAERQMQEDLERDHTDEQLLADGAAGALVGLYPAGIDLKAESLKLLRNQVAGFYDPYKKQMVLVAGGGDIGIFANAAGLLAQRDLAGEMLLAHELTHALQDQNFDLGKKLDAIKANDDRTLALKAVAEGDATIAGFAYVSGRMDNETLTDLLPHLDEIAKAFAAEAPNTPEGLSVPLLFQYSDGVRFVGDAYRRGGWKAVDALYANPPTSTRQVIHSTLYFDRPTPPSDVSVRGYEQLMHSWNKVDEDTYGELLLRVILERNLGKRSPEVALARHWIGDDMVILRSGRVVSVIWIVAFKDTGIASQFAAVYTTVLDKLLGETAHEIDYRNNAVLIVIGEAAHYMGALAPAIWANSKVGNAPAPLSLSH